PRAPAAKAQPAANPPASAAPAQPAPAAEKPAQQPAPAAAQPAPAAAQPAQQPAPAAAAGSKTRMNFGSSSPGSSFYVYSVAVAKFWNTQAPEVEATSVATGGCLENIRRMETGELQAGLACPDLTFRAMNGLEEFKDKPLTKQRVLWIFGVGAQGFFTGKDTGLKTWKDLDGKDFIAGMKGSSTEQQGKAVLDVLGIKPKLRSGGVEEMIQSYVSKQIVGFVKLQPGPRAGDAGTLEAHTARPVNLLGMSAEDEAKIKERYPWYAAFVDVEPNGLSNGLPDQKVRTVGLVNAIGVVSDTPEDLAYKLTKLSVEDKVEQATAYPAVKGIDFVKLTFEQSLTPLHAGAYRYYREIGQQIPDKLKPPEMK
ncbi:MAG: TAXI family TRAP transporter solute-binding subunit, partial [Chloroflexi bacterium]|nr:TAXI family TRAP transporter solute-binding subunit [Chloroflexota bacterium]